ncbi:hypothetical protein SISNIDRAFT_452424 [Sistotremastrum niveocremeum HHB9708]|uniref:Secreted protein n=2 Tax=Sistotremastraceae TaxID=3402574 RepID=A0A164WJH8_9AGAM|nr:hypothetical protein SISNIDRAFT_452424 [Sistotremastrum niveocremeum HHB9708]KZT34629.1 hypothetical protein SISSUDRAFT_1052524 [Sistotremastrum suecicum HHB10207 ss-3]
MFFRLSTVPLSVHLLPLCARLSFRLEPPDLKLQRQPPSICSFDFSTEDASITKRHRNHRDIHHNPLAQRPELVMIRLPLLFESFPRRRMLRSTGASIRTFCEDAQIFEDNERAPSAILPYKSLKKLKSARWISD